MSTAASLISAKNVAMSSSIPSLWSWILFSSKNRFMKPAWIAIARNASRNVNIARGILATAVMRFMPRPTCRDCGKEFVITVGEHDFLVNHGYENMPVRCRDCRHKRQVNALVTDMRRMGEEPVDTIITSDEPIVPHEDAAEMVPDIDAMPEQVDVAAATEADTRLPKVRKPRLSATNRQR